MYLSSLDNRGKVKTKNKVYWKILVLKICFLPASLLNSSFSQGYQWSRHCLDTMNHSVGNYTFQKHACVPVYIDHLEVLLLPQLKYKKNKHKHQELSSDCSFLQNANKVKKKTKNKKKQNTNYQGLRDNLLILFIQKQFLGTN